MLLHEREAAVDVRLRALLSMVQQDRGLTLPAPHIQYVTRVKYAGKAYYYRNTIVLSRDFLERNFEDMICNTVPHELAHLITFQLFPRAKPHGFTWQSIMADWFHLDPLRCHYYDTRFQTVDLSDLL